MPRAARERESAPVACPPSNANSGTSGAEPISGLPGSDDGTPWVLLTAVAIAMLALGAGTSYLFVQKRP